MNVNELLDTIEDLLEESTGMPLSGGKRIVDVEQIRDYLDDIRANLPVELRQAQSIVSDRAQLIESANAQAQAIVKKAEERARILVSEAEIVRAAQQRASEIVSAAQTEARTVRQTVTDYCDNMLKTTEETMAENAVVFACANPVPEINPETAKAAGVRVLQPGGAIIRTRLTTCWHFRGSSAECSMCMPEK